MTKRLLTSRVTRADAAGKQADLPDVPLALPGVSPTAVRLLKAGAEAFAERGFHATTTRDIATRVGPVARRRCTSTTRRKGALLAHLSVAGPRGSARPGRRDARTATTRSRAAARHGHRVRHLARRAPPGGAGRAVRAAVARRGDARRRQRPAPADGGQGRAGRAGGGRRRQPDGCLTRARRPAPYSRWRSTSPAGSTRADATAPPTPAGSTPTWRCGCWARSPAPLRPARRSRAEAETTRETA